MPFRACLLLQTAPLVTFSMNPFDSFSLFLVFFFVFFGLLVFFLEIIINIFEIMNPKLNVCTCVYTSSSENLNFVFYRLGRIRNWKIFLK